ncbi:hypothetical protein FB451DRAFT_1239388 [Mycena latifolia]|nr:hypothetical protein FB451DRAFT_1239388 [Mycena latifolia]
MKNFLVLGLLFAVLANAFPTPKHDLRQFTSGGGVVSGQIEPAPERRQFTPGGGVVSGTTGKCGNSICLVSETETTDEEPTHERRQFTSGGGVVSGQTGGSGEKARAFDDFRASEEHIGQK